VLTNVAIVALSYVLGSVPFGLLVAKLLSKQDVRRVGSGNVGATNVVRAAGKSAGAITLLLDAGKGYLAVALAQTVSASPQATLPLVAGLAALLGHCFSLFLRLKGGKGVATGLGIFLRICPACALIALAVFAICAAITRFVSAGSIAAAASAPVSLAILSRSYQQTAFAIAVATLIIIRHRANISRLIHGTELRLGRK